MGFYALTGRTPGKSPDLAYVIGVLLGDGCCYRMAGGNTHHYSGEPARPSWRIELQTVDAPFAQAFADALGRTVKRPETRHVRVLPPRPGRTPTRRPVYRVCVASRGFGDWWQEVGASADLLWPHVASQPTAFLRGLYDSEGNLCYSVKGTPTCRIFNTEQWILTLARDCLELLDMRGEVRLFRSARSAVIMGRPVNARSLYFLAPVPARQFLQLVGSSIADKSAPIHI